MSNAISALIPPELLKGTEEVTSLTDGIFEYIVSEEVCRRADILLRMIYDYDDQISLTHPFSVLPMWSSFMEAFTSPNAALLIATEMDKLIDYSCTSFLFLDFSSTTTTSTTSTTNSSTNEWHRQPKTLENAIFHVANHLLSWSSSRPLIWDVEEIAQEAPKEDGSKIPIILIKSPTPNSTNMPSIVKLMKLTNLIWKFAAFPHLPVFILDNEALNHLSLAPLHQAMDFYFLGQQTDDFELLQDKLCLSVAQRILDRFDLSVDSSFILGLQNLPLKIDEWKKMTILSLIEVGFGVFSAFSALDDSSKAGFTITEATTTTRTTKEGWKLVSLIHSIWGEDFSSNMLQLFLNPNLLNEAFIALRASTAALPANDRRSAFFRAQLGASASASSLNDIILDVEERINSCNCCASTAATRTTLSLPPSTRKSCFPLVGESLQLALEADNLFRTEPVEHQRLKDIKAAYKIMTEHSLIINGFDWFMAWKLCVDCVGDCAGSGVDCGVATDALYTSKNKNTTKNTDDTLQRFLHCLYELQLMGMIRRWKKRNDIYERVYVFHK